MRKSFAALACCLFCIIFTGCGSQISFTWADDRVAKNLDPQLASESPELIAVANLYRGLFRLDAQGQPQPDCAESYTVSPDGLSYTFRLKSGLAYYKLRGHSQEYTVTAQDFVFGLQRVFRAETGSPYTGAFACIRNSGEVLAGRLPENQLGISAPSADTLVIELSTPDPQLLHKLCLPGAMPCNEEFFESTQGSYGLKAASTLANGNFYLYNWNENGLFLRRAAQGDLVTSLRLVLNATGESSSSAASGQSAASAAPLRGEALVTQGGATAALSDSADSQSLAALPYTATTWTLVFNCENELLAQPLLRQALAASALTAQVELPQDFGPADGLVPPAMTAQGQNYRATAGSALSAFGEPAALCRDGLAAAGQSRFSGVTFLVPEGEPYAGLAAALNQQWQKQLGAWSAYFSLKTLPLEELKNQVAAGNYQIALLPVSPASDDVLEALSAASVTRWQNAEYTAMLSALRANGGYTAAQLAAAERLLLEQAAVVPLWYHSQALLVEPAVNGLVFRPFGPVLDFTWTTIKQ